ncbi:DUF5597 domain-containing protein [Pseudolysinimonas yzui]|uniref:Beta-galactosidase n=1 Tax=Pseudolysinimonas yzui TaxID=2708254 RepID=A0A8J3M4D1_9MICO|nr:DUF5597 domain-containing protein [Pseudolysinimonas yzui]GHF15936.1 beta-galactosidase [Pseudolysinimonas yzui]
MGVDPRRNPEVSGQGRGAWALDQQGVLRRDGVPALLLGGQVHNSSTSTESAIRESFARARAVNANTVLAPVSWALFEPEEGAFDTTLIDRMIEEARANGLRLVPLWFGAVKNAGSGYAPSWVRADPERFPRAVVSGRGKAAFTYEGATAKPVLSLFGENLLQADASAFAALLRRITEVDHDGIVAMVQVENEAGILTDSRDRSGTADAVWASLVPRELITALAAGDGISPSARRWRERGGLLEGTWESVFGDDDRAEEIFMACGVASYIEGVARRGRAESILPLYTNAWLGPQPGQESPGQYPSGGPTSTVIDVWKAMAPTLALVAPDIYVEDAAGAMAVYARADQPLFVPESQPRTGELVRALGTFSAIGWSAFGVDELTSQGTIAQLLGHLTALEAPLLAARERRGLGSVVIESPEEIVELTLGQTELHARGSVVLFHHLLVDVGVQVPLTTPEFPDETEPGAMMPAAADPRPFALIAAESDDEFLVIGRGVTLDFVDPTRRIEIDSAEELRLEDGVHVVSRVLNGDERLQLLPVREVGVVRIRLLRF